MVGQVALSLLLVAGAGLFARSLYNLRGIDPGFVADHLLQLGRRLAERLRRSEALALAAGCSRNRRRLPVSPRCRWQVAGDDRPGSFQTVSVQGYDPAAGEAINSAINNVGPGYFATLGVPLVMGRAFGADVDGRQLVAIVNEAMANHFWPGQTQSGAGSGAKARRPVEVVGVVRDPSSRTCVTTSR